MESPPKGGDQPQIILQTSGRVLSQVNTVHSMS